MNYELLIVLAGLMSYVIVGLCALTLCGLKIEFPAKLALGFGTGAGIVSLVLFIYSMVGVPLSFLTVLLPWFVLFLYLLKNKKVLQTVKKDKEDFVPIDYLFLTLIAISVLIAIFYALSSSVSAFDAVANWSMLAKVFYFERSLGGDLYRFLNIDNPPLVSLQQSFLSILMGKYNDRQALLIFPAYFISLLVLFYNLAKKLSTKTNALIFTFFLASTPMVLGQAGRMSVGYMDIVLSYFIFASIFVLHHLLRGSRPKHIFLLGLLLSFAALVKNEGLGIVLISSIIIFVILKKDSKLKYLFYLMIGLIPIFVFRLYSEAENFPSHYLYSGYLILTRVPEIIRRFVFEVFALSRWNFLWIAFIISLFFIRKDKFMLIVLSVLIFQIFVYFSIYLVTPINFSTHIEASLDRFLMQVTPLALLVTSYAFSRPSVYK